MTKVRFHHYAWGLLAYNLAVILGGSFVRASRSGDGCGAHWPNCNGELIPTRFAQLKTLIEFSHRASSGLLVPLILLLFVWAFRAYPKGDPARSGAAAAIGLTVVEALIGAGLVLFKLVAHNHSAPRAVMMPIHLVTTFLLLASLTLTAFWSSGGRRPVLRGHGAMGGILAIGVIATILLGISGAITALGDTLFPAQSLAEGLRQDFTPGSHFLLGLRIYHPLIAMCAGVYTMLLASLAMHLRPDPDVRRFAYFMLGLFLVQMGAGLLNLLMLAPIWMQLIHLLLADLFWIGQVLLTAAAIGEGVPQVELAAVSPAAAGIAGAAGWRDYLALTKPRVISLLLLTTLAAVAIAAGDSGRHVGFGLYAAVGLGLYMAAGSANAINMVLERDLDLAMGRTAKRPTVTQSISARSALQFALVLAVGSFAILWSAANLLSAMLALAGLAFYVVVYTLLLKRRTWANIVIGGAAGAFPPLVGYAAVTNDLTPLAWCLFGLIFLWTPVHFWALALMIKEDYARAGVPMLPVVRGERATVVQIAYYTVLTVAISALPFGLQSREGQGGPGWFYLAAAVLLNAVLLLRSAQLFRKPERPQALSLFKYSMVYLALLFLAMAVDRTRWI